MYPGPYPQPYAYPARAPFRDSRPLVRSAAALWVVGTLIGLVTTLIESNRNADRLARYRAGETPARSLDGSLQFRFAVGGSTLLTVILSLASFLLVIVAMFRLAKNHQALGRPGTRWTPGWAIAGWLIPLASAVLPYLQIRELWRGSDAELGLDASDWTRRKAHRACVAALALSVTAGALNIIRFFANLSSFFDSINGLGDDDAIRIAVARASADGRALQALAGVCTLVGIALGAWLLLQISERQQVLAERLQLVGPGSPTPFMPAIPPFAATFAPRWAADPWGRFQLRWWDGTRWTAHVSTGGGTAYDPLNDIPPAPPS